MLDSQSRNNSDNIAIILGVADDIENPSRSFQPMRPIRPTRPPIRQSIPVDLNSMYEEKIQNLELRLEEYENSNIHLIEDNDKLKENLIKLIESYPKKFLFEKIMEDKCSICLEAYKYGEEIAVTNCLHLFHKDCIDKSIEQNCIDCPNCRFKLSDSVFLYLKFNLEMKGVDFL